MREKKEKEKDERCFFNFNVSCAAQESVEHGKCNSCGFNPAVEPRRKQEARDRANGVRPVQKKPVGSLEADILRLQKRLIRDADDGDDEEDEG